MSPLTFAMSTATRHSAQTSSYFIPGQPFPEIFVPLSYSNQDHTFIGDYIISIHKQQTRLLLRLQRNVYRSDNQPLQFCLSILETFIPHSKIYMITHYWQHAKCQFNPFIPVFLLTTITNTKRLPFNPSFIKLLKLKTLRHLRSSPFISNNIARR